MSIKKNFELCYFKVPIVIEDVPGEDEGTTVKEASFVEVEMKELCYKKELKETETSEEAMLLAKEVANWNQDQLRMYALTNKSGDIVTRRVLCLPGKVNINTNLI